MVRCLMYPNYTDNYYYEEGSTTIALERNNSGKIVYRNWLQFDTPEQAQKYFEEKCGA